MSDYDKSEKIMYDAFKLVMYTDKLVIAKMGIPTYKHLRDLLEQRQEERERMRIQQESLTGKVAPTDQPLAFRIGGFDIRVDPLIPENQVWIVAQPERENDPAIVKILKFGTDEVHIERK